MAKEFLSLHGIQFDYKDITADPEALAEMLGYTGGRRGVPVIVIGDEVLRGFDRGRISELLGLTARA